MRAIIIISLLLLSACASEGITPTSSPTPWEGTLSPLVSLEPQFTPSITLSTLQTIQSTPSLTASTMPTATAIPVTYKVAKNDDMFGIAFKYGISPQALMTANPKVNPRAMSVGTLLIIPVTPVPGTKNPSKGATPRPQATPTYSLASSLRPPDCYPSGDGGVWCFWLIQSSPVQGVDSVTGTISLSVKGANGAPLEQAASTPLDIIPAGGALPLAAYFPPPVPTPYQASGKLITFLPIPEHDNRYLPVVIQDLQSSIAGTGAQIVGRLALPVGSMTAKSLRVAVTALSSDNAVVGLRTWESNTALVGGGVLPFTIQVESLGPPISRVAVLAEARP